MTRKLLAILLIIATFFTSAVSGRNGWEPLSQEFAEKNHLAQLLFLILASLLVYFTGFCWRLDWRWLARITGLMLPTLGVIAFTGPKTMIHLTAFAVFLCCGVVWLSVFSNAVGHTWIAVLTWLLLISGLVIGFIVGFVGIMTTELYRWSPLGLYQKAFLLLFSAVAMCMPEIHLTESEEDSLPDQIADS